MYKLKIIAPLFLVLTAAISHAQTATTEKKKKTVNIVKAHRGTIVTEIIHEKVGRQAQARYAALPKLGTVVTDLPAGAVVVMKDSISYFYKNGFYYSQGPKGYQVVLPVAGVRIRGLPITYRRVALGEITYFYYYGVFYAQAGSSDNYDVIIAPDGAVIDAIPDGYKVQKVDNIEYYLLGDTYYAEVEVPDMEGKTGYKVVTIIQAY